MTILNNINTNLKKASTGLKNYKEGIQNALDLFIVNYEGELNKNSEPLLKIIKTVKPNDKRFLTQWLVDFTNIKATVTKKGGLSIKTSDGNPVGYIETPNRFWYEKDEAEKDPKEWILEEVLKKLIKKAEKEGFTKADVSKALSKM